MQRNLLLPAFASGCLLSCRLVLLRSALHNLGPIVCSGWLVWLVCQVVGLVV